MEIDLSPVIQALLGLAALAIGTFGAWALQRLAVRFGIQIDAARKEQLETALTKAAQAGAVAVEGMAAERGWNHPAVKSEMLGQGLNYLVDRFADTLKQAGLDPYKIEDAERIRGAMERIMPAAAAPVAASPVTATGPDATAEVLNRAELARHTGDTP